MSLIPYVIRTYFHRNCFFLYTLMHIECDRKQKNPINNFSIYIYHRQTESQLVKRILSQIILSNLTGRIKFID